MTRLPTLLLAGVSLLPVAAHAQVLPDVNVASDRLGAPLAAPSAAAPPAALSRPAALVTSREIANFTPRTNDTAEILSNIAGVSVYQAGGVSSLPVIHGLNDDRNTVVLGGVPISSACANHMNPPLSYVDPSAIGQVEVFTVNTPVSKGGDAIGGAILVTPRPPVFATAGAPTLKGPAAEFAPGLLVSGSISGSYRSNGDAFGVAGHIDMATEHFALQYDGAWSKSNNYTAGGGATVPSTLYDANTHAATLSYRNDDQLISFRYSHQAIPYQGFPNQWMDMMGNNANTFDLSWKGGFGWGRMEANAYYHITQHYMNNLADKNGGVNASPTTGMPMYVNGQDFGYKVKAEIDLGPTDLARVGNELHMQRMNEWWPPVPGTAPMMCCQTFVNLNNAQRNVLSTYAEWERRWTGQWSTLLGLRNDTVWTNTGDVQGYSMMYLRGLGGIPGGFGSSTYFNAQEHAKTFVNFDVTALARYVPSATSGYEFGYTLKQRAPSIYELYAWSTNSMAAAMIGWFGDGNGYVGNLNLKPETAHTLSVTGQWSDPTQKVWSAKLTPYYTYVQNFIDVNNLGPSMMGGNLLQFANHDAQLAGFDLSGRALLLPETAIGDISVSGVAGYVYGQRTDGYYLYHMMPIYGKVALEDAVAIGGGRLTGAFELRAVAAKTEVETLRLEPSTPGFAVMNLRAAYEWQNLRFDLGVENLADKLYYEPLGGIALSNYIQSNYTQPWGQPLAAKGRSVFGAMTVKF
ncbi:TonB-dependent receptor plug domain-containing protein [Rhodoblastus acidophilus]|uniref:TonB-dependent receptor plug domain-containing protein n=1 Tax=Rhodoblastus acidophilus TaxID=1074 RepID=A0A6N8DJ51_RHOAC|nr:TonB-dependent receptor [Rhodoblastus acidophilus]MCW2272950.1 iron complex outermembrane receptor protein [Rhodoblastus acidophilus]MTV29856.1 TonB-dependent receptor plug domain-containing protein [Rhodoblastus acidophilus]